MTTSLSPDVISPCLHCGAHDWRLNDNSDKDNTLFRVFCNGCKINVQKDTAQECIDALCRRPAPPKPCAYGLYYSGNPGDLDGDPPTFCDFLGVYGNELDARSKTNETLEQYRARFTVVPLFMVPILH